MGTEALVQAALRGDPAGREALARAWLGPVYGAALARTGHPADAEDLTQEAFLRAFQRLGSLREPARFGPWILRIVRNAVVDAHRRRHGTTSLAPEAAAALEGRPGAEPGRSGDVLAALRTLDEDTRLVCWLQVVDGMPLREIAELLDRSKSAVHRMVGEGLARLRREMVSC